VDLPIDSMVIFQLCKRLPEGTIGQFVGGKSLGFPGWIARGAMAAMVS